MTDTQKGTLFLKHALLRITLPDGSIKSVTLVRDVTQIGRETDNQFVVPAALKSISRKHLEIRREGGQYIVADLGSDNGTLLNGQPVAQAFLKDGDEIRIGMAEHDHELVIEFQAGSEALLSGKTTPADHSPVNLASDAPSGVPYLRIRFPKGEVSFLPIEKDLTLVGRSANADLIIPDGFGFVSAEHFEIYRMGDSFVVTDLNSTNGTLLNNHPLSPNKPQDLHNNAIIRIGDDTFGISLGITFVNPLEEAPEDGFAVAGATQFMDTAKPLSIGRAPESDIHLDAPDVSRRHASIVKREQAYVLSDLGSRNGTFVNDQLIQSTELHEGDIIRIGAFLLTFQDGQITPYQSNGMRMDVTNLSKDVDTRKGKLRILDDINLSVLPREFVAIVGGSGAGKTTLLNALVGIRPGEGSVKLNGHDFYKEYEHYRAQLGYVPQNDILHMTLTVEKALDYTARLRLPPGLDKAERERRITAVLETVSMNTETIRKTRIGNLSGGQRKRVSIAAELLADPKLIYLDEATSGLDPGLEKKMMHTLRRMADEGRTVMLITHATDNIVQTDHVAFISQGKLVFFGPSKEALDFFEVDEFADIYEKIERHGEEWEKVFEETKPEAHEKYVLARQANAQATPKRELPKIKFGLGDFFRQLLVLTQRSLNVLFSDPITLVLLLLLLPLTGTLQLIIGSKDVLTGNLGIMANVKAAAESLTESYIPFARTNTFVFVMGLEAVLTGLFVPSNDLVKERSIYLRERMVNLKVLPYLLSKAAIYSVFVVVQVALYLLILSFGINLPEQGLYLNGTLELFITLFLTMMAGITFGFIVSAISRNTEMAIYILTLLLFFQFFFAGTVFDLRGNTFEPMSYLTTTRWSLTAIGVTVDMPEIVGFTIICSDVPENPLDPNSEFVKKCDPYPEATDDLLLDYSDDMLLKSWGVLIGMSILFLGITGVLLERTKSG